jgi:hypothetical protein
MDPFLALIESSHKHVRQSTALDPDGHEVRQALLVATRAAVAAGTAPAAESVKWDLFYVAVAAAVTELEAELPDPALLPDDLRPHDIANEHLRTSTATLIASLADLYAAAAAASEAGSPWRRPTWANVAHHLDAAAAHLR